MAAVPRTRLYYFVEQGMQFRVTVTLRAPRMKSWIRRVHRDFVDHAPEESRCVGLDCEFTDAVKKVKRRNLLLDKRQCAAVLQLSVVS
jgi:hypothetical protein